MKPSEEQANHQSPSKSRFITSGNRLLRQRNYRTFTEALNSPHPRNHHSDFLSRAGIGPTPSPRARKLSSQPSSRNSLYYPSLTTPATTTAEAKKASTDVRKSSQPPATTASPRQLKKAHRASVIKKALAGSLTPSQERGERAS